MIDAPIFDRESDSRTGEAWARALYERQIGFLDRVAETGVAITGDVARIAKDAWCVDGVHTAALAHARAARAVRLTLMLQARVIRAVLALDKAAPAGAAEGEAEGLIPVVRSGPLNLPAEPKAQTADDDAGSDAAEHLVAEAAERLDRDELDGLLLTHQDDDLMEMIFNDLGLNLPFPSMGKGPGIGVFAPEDQETPLKAVSTQTATPTPPPEPHPPPTADTPQSSPRRGALASTSGSP